MRLKSEEMRRLYQRQSSRAFAGHVDCLTDNIMARAANGEMNRSSRVMISEHLMACSDCAHEYRLLLRLKPMIGQATVSPAESVSVIGPVEKQEALKRVVISQPRFLRRVFPSRIARYARFAAFLAIGLLCVVTFFFLRRQNADMASQLKEQISRSDQANKSVEVTNYQLAQAIRRTEQQQQEIIELRRSIDDFSQPQVNMPITDVGLQSFRGDVGEGITTITVPRDGNLFTVILHDAAAGPSNAEYSIDVLDGDGQPVREVKGLYRSPEETFTVTLSKRLLPAGRYRLRLYSFYAGGRKVIGDYPISLQYR